MRGSMDSHAKPTHTPTPQPTDAEREVVRAGRDAEIFAIDKTFADLGLKAKLLEGITARGFIHPTKIQATLIPAALMGRDVLGQAKTGTGKTAAFGLPLLHLLDTTSPFSALVLVPTRELAVQVAKELQELGSFADVRTVAVYGGQEIRKQVAQLEKNPAIVVGTPGRVMDLHQRGLLPYDRLRFAILDEVDRMLDIGFRDDIRKILGSIKGAHQTIFVSATISPEIEKLARSFMKDPEKIISVEKSLTVSQVKQSYISVEGWDKRKLLLHLLTHEEPEVTIVFCRTKRTVDDVTEFLVKHKIEAHAMHGDLQQARRDRVMKELRAGGLSVLVASDLAARGLDVDDISHVINYDVPEDPEVYVHRIGRTARAGRDGVAWMFVTSEQGELLTNIEMLTNVEIPRIEYPEFKPGTVPSEVRARRERADEQRAAAQETRNRMQPAKVEQPTNTTLYPDGLVPIAQPNKRLGGRVRTNRR
ncbi:MAG: DEAD/DEAH box helicase [Phycisphaerales bacterium]|nr:DEAD/DEAH box helicase [Phycisphaerales bacterium]